MNVEGPSGGSPGVGVGGGAASAGEPEDVRGAYFHAGSSLFALGLLLVLYRLAVTLAALMVASGISMCCCCGAVEADKLSGGFSGAWTMVGETFGKVSGDAYMSILYFPASDTVTMFAFGMLILGVVLMVIPAGGGPANTPPPAGHGPHDGAPSPPPNWNPPPPPMGS
jgi:hypothetical protein